MEILGIGTDIVEIERMAEACERSPRFETRVFRQAELDYARPKAGKFAHLAARFAAKEAVAKAFGRSFSWQDVEIVTEPSGKPTVRLYGEAEKVADGARVMISMSHSALYATAVAVLVKDR